MHINVEIKAKCPDSEAIRAILLASGADYRGRDQQEDTYYKIPSGRLKLRLGPIENSLIFYNRNNQAGPKTSEVTMMQVTDGLVLKEILAKSLGVRVTVIKMRDIYFIDNVKFHLDEVPRLGNFVEIEAIDTDGSFSRETLEKQCKYYIDLFNIRQEDLLQRSYSDMLMELD